MSILVFEHSDTARVLRLGAVFRNYGHQLDIRRLHRGDPMPTDLDDVHGVIVCGVAPHSANDTEPAWIEQTAAYLRDAHEAGVPIVGLCFGHQLLARALGGTVDRVESGVEIGWHEVRMTAAGKDDPVYTGIPWSSPQFEWHHDEVRDVPEGARVLAMSDGCAVQAWALGLTTYGFQYHPEFDDAAILALMDEEPQDIEEAGTTREQLIADTEASYATHVRLGDRLFESIALFLMPVDRRYKGLVKDLHH